LIQERRRPGEDAAPCCAVRWWGRPAARWVAASTLSIVSHSAFNRNERTSSHGRACDLGPSRRRRIPWRSIYRAAPVAAVASGQMR
jgi:hypothetical protein